MTSIQDNASNYERLVKFGAFCTKELDTNLTYYKISQELWESKDTSIYFGKQSIPIQYLKELCNSQVLYARMKRSTSNASYIVVTLNPFRATGLSCLLNPYQVGYLALNNSSVKEYIQDAWEFAGYNDQQVLTEFNSYKALNTWAHFCCGFVAVLWQLEKYNFPSNEQLITQINKPFTELW